MIAKPRPGPPQDRPPTRSWPLSPFSPPAICPLSCDCVHSVQNGARCSCGHRRSIVPSATTTRWLVSGPVRLLSYCPMLTEYASRLPQWEGVQRQWYYVQRATGKSQWDIPTEPVVLTPSTTPTSIGTGPSQASPSRPSTNSPCVTATGNSLVDRMESAADKARFSVRNHAHNV